MSGSDTRDEAVYDAYLEACAAGTAEDPAAVRRRHPDLGPAVAERIEALWRIRLRSATTAAPPRRLGAYRLLERIDGGGMGTVSRAVCVDDGSEAAVKVLRPELASSRTALERFRREAVALSRVRHVNVVRVLAFGEEGTAAYLAMELVPGRGLERIVADATARGELLAVDRVARWGAALARGLAAAHREGVVHRDVKPSNVIVRPDDVPVLLDFGIAQVPEATPGALTTTFAGSPFYAAPEQLVGGTTDGRTDVYGLCATLYQCLTGRVPFASDRFEEVRRRTLDEDPVPVRRLAPGVPRALEIVVLAGLEKEPARRPQTADVLAEELDRALTGGRIRSRPAGFLRRTARSARRHPRVSAALALASLAAAGLGIGAASVRSAERRRVLDEARGALAEAERAIARTAGAPGRLAELEVAVGQAEALLTARWLPDDVISRLDADARDLDRARREHDAELRTILSALDRAERLAPGLDGLGAARAAFHAARWRERTAAGDAAAAAFEREQALRADPEGPAAREFARGAVLRIAPDPPDADVHLFRVVPRDEIVPSSGRFLVPVPARGTPAAIDGAPWALRVVRGAGDVPEGSHILSIEGRPVESAWSAGAAPVERATRGGVAATVWRDGALRELVLPPGLEVRATAAPLLEGSASRIAAAEWNALELPPGEYVVLLRHPERIDVRAPLRLALPGTYEVALRLPLPEERPDGCVLVRSPEWESGSGWIQEREVTAGEYLEFLDDPATRARIDASPTPVLVPRHEVDPPLWPRGADGRFRLPDGTTPDHPVLGVSYDDAEAYARWRSARAEAAGEPWRFRLPLGGEWVSAGGSHLMRRFPFGPTFRPRWASSCFTGPYPAPVPVLSHPVDESAFGVFDLCGSAMEWCGDWYGAPRGLRRLRGGSWAQGDPDALTVWAPHGARPDRADREFGFRLVVERVAADGPAPGAAAAPQEAR